MEVEKGRESFYLILKKLFSPMDNSNSTGSSFGFTIVAEKKAEKSLYLRLRRKGCIKE